jgi:hypothetical protein
MKRIAIAALCATLTTPAAALEMPTDPVQRVGLIAAISALAQIDCPNLEGDRAGAHAAVRASGVEPAQMASEPYRSAMQEWIAAFHHDPTRHYCDIFLRAFGPSGEILPGLVRPVWQPSN